MWKIRRNSSVDVLLMPLTRHWLQMGRNGDDVMDEVAVNVLTTGAAQTVRQASVDGWTTDHSLYRKSIKQSRLAQLHCNQEREREAWFGSLKRVAQFSRESEDRQTNVVNSLLLLTFKVKQFQFCFGIYRTCFKRRLEDIFVYLLCVVIFLSHWFCGREGKKIHCVSVELYEE